MTEELISIAWIAFLLAVFAAFSPWYKIPVCILRATSRRTIQTKDASGKAVTTEREIDPEEALRLVFQWSLQAAVMLLAFAAIALGLATFRGTNQMQPAGITPRAEVEQSVRTAPALAVTVNCNHATNTVLVPKP